LHDLIAKVTRLMDTYLYGEAGRQIYEFLWNEYADWYIEISKIALYGGDPAAKSRTRHILTTVLDQCLRMLHPFVPFVTEEIWQHIPHEGEALIVARWPQPDPAYLDRKAETQMGILMDLIRGIRNIRAEYNVPPSRRISAQVSAGEWAKLLGQHRELFTRLANVDGEGLHIEDTISSPPPQSASVTVGSLTAYLPLAGLVDLDAERARLRKELEAAAAQIARSEALLSGDGFAKRAPTEVVQREKDKLENLRATHASLEERLKSLG
jgi:valyl-tRNA synthetase